MSYQANVQAGQAKTKSAADQILNHPVAKQIQDRANYYVSQLDKELGKYPYMNQIEQKTSVPKAWVFLGTFVLLLIGMLFNALAAPISNFIGWLLPAYLSFRALETKEADDDIQWLTYWIVFGFFNFLESVALSAVLYYLPFYYVFKTAFVIWLQLPATKGARVLYLTVARPLLDGSRRAPPPATTTATSDDLRAKVASANAL
ncbi:hypothetical protein DACRYDRAFT_24099 [Dacryopinax primogenitus]|uniref:Protein YOP1 n=1 Tax=Dacryopinax primogenitus (strain DJM 731) TaxID=1858805 RepID=M5G5G4_DACPD|nr:uncharacterized protein DACRYDRAFT_24099 [Dacryopinax primogenitus]EJT98997.1 hypothetical protein DACRYDRAFT_24099 [Dacryopinax primogenitus]